MSGTIRRYLAGAPNEELFGFSQGMEHAGLVAIAGQVGKDNTTGEMVGPNEFRARYGRTAENIHAIAAELLGDGARIVQAQAHVALPLGDVWDELGAEHRQRFGADAPATGVVAVKALARPDYLVEVSAMATAANVTTVPDAGPVGSFLGSSRAVRVGDTVFLGGHLPLDESGRVAGEGAPEQLDLAARNLAQTLAELGARLDACFAVNVFVAGSPGPEDLAAISAANRAHFGAAKPTSTLVFVPELPFGALVQLSGTAVLVRA